MADTIRADIRERLKANLARWRGVEILSPGQPDAPVRIEWLTKALGILRSGAHRKIVTDEFLGTVVHRPTVELAMLIVEQADPKGRKRYTDREAADIVSGHYEASPSAVAEAQRQLDDDPTVPKF